MRRLGHLVVLSVMLILAQNPLHAEETGEEQAEPATDAGATRTGRRYEAWFIDGLPIIGHQYQDVLVLTAGVLDPDGDGNPNVHGASETGLQYRLDGGDVTDPGSGTFGFNMNPLIIESIDAITAGAPAEYGRAGGGFADITTRSGGNDFSGRFSVYWRGSLLDGDDPGNNDINTYDRELDDYQDIRPALSLGGPIVKDRLWYFVSAELIEAEEPVRETFFDAEIDSRAAYSFGKLTLQGNPSNKASVQVMWEDRTDEGLGLSFFTNSTETAFDHERNGYTAGLSWITNLSPSLLLETSITHMDLETSITPASEHFEPFAPRFAVDTRVIPNIASMFYPCKVVNCSPFFGEKSTYQVDGFNRRVDGPYYSQSEDTRTRSAFKSAISYFPPDAWGSHALKAGFEVTEEELSEELTVNPQLIDLTVPASFFIPSPFALSGWQIVTAPDSLETDGKASSLNTGFFIQDSWKPRGNLTINAGLRLDRQELETLAVDFIDPREERQDAIDIWWAFCEEAFRQSPQAVPGVSNCHPVNDYDGQPPTFVSSNQIRSFLDADMNGVNDVPAKVASLDLDGDGFINSSTNDRAAFFREFTLPSERSSGDYTIENSDLSPRIGIAWDPWSDGKTRLFAHWGRYHDRILLETVLAESGPSITNSSFLPDANGFFFPTMLSVAGSNPTIAQVDPGIETPRTDELSLGFEREVGSEWSFGLTYIRKKGYDLLQDADTNHFTCVESGRAIGIPPSVVCGDINGNLDTDRFGTLTSAFPPPGGGFRTASAPNGVTDLYTFNSNFSKVLTIDNRTSLDYEAYEVTIRKRLHRNWQMEASYTWSESLGQPSDPTALDDAPDVLIEDDALLDHDRRHVFKFQAVTRLPHGIGLGAAVRYESGTPYTTVGTIFEEDSARNHDVHLYLPSGEINDERNEGIWRIDGRVEKSFTAGGVDISGYLLVENLLDSDDLEIRQAFVEVDSPNVDAARDAGRRFEIGAIVDF